MSKNIIIKNASSHNLKNINVEIPRNKITTLVGLSGSGKSTIAYNILASEGQRQFLESISTYAARLLKRDQKGTFDKIENLSPTISIDQKRMAGNSRSTVGTATEIHSFLRLLFSRFGSNEKLSASHFSFNSPKGACSKCKGLGMEYTIDPNDVIDFEKSLNEDASKVNIFKKDSRYFNIIKLSGKLDLDKKIKDYTKEELDFLLYSDKVVLTSAEDKDFVQSFSHEGIITRLVGRAMDLRRENGNKDFYLIQKKCSLCDGGRLKQKVLESKINGKNIAYFTNISLNELINEMEIIKKQIPETEELVDRVINTSKSLINVDLGYLSLDRTVDTLSGGESQRLKLARELGSDLIEMIYILDEPTAGLHPKDGDNLIEILKQIKNSGNTVVVVEHDEEVMKNSDHIIEIGPGAGKNGGNIVFQGSFEELKKASTITAKFLNSEKSKLKRDVRMADKFLEVKNASSHNLKNIDVKLPLKVFTSLVGVSGSGKSSLIEELIKQNSDKKITLINQKSLTGTARGNIATYSGIFNEIRNIFAKENNVKASLFSSNSEGACRECSGLGYIKMDMHFMGEMQTVCEVCHGKKYIPEVLEYKYKEKNINDVLNMTVREAINFFDDYKKITKQLNLLNDVGLGYLTLGQTHDTFSGGESQRLKLATKLDSKNEIFILDEPTSGLHFADIEKLLLLLNRLVANGNSIIVIEHNLDVIRQSDWIIELGPKGGKDGGNIIAEGAPEKIKENRNSVTGEFM